MARRRALSIEEVAAEVGRLFGTTEVHARKWLEQRNHLLDALHTVRGRATELINQIGSQPSPRDTGEFLKQPGQRSERKKRRFSPEAIARMRAAAKRRWAEKKKAAAK